MSVQQPIRRKLDVKNGRVDLSHGAGGRAMGQLIEDIFHAAFDNEWLRAGNDQSAFEVEAGRMVMTTDGYVVSPIFFPGGDIGSLAVHGTINDIAMAGARPLYLSASFFIEEGFPLADLKRIATSMGEASREAGVPIITGDTKVVERGKADGVFISTAGVGVAPPGLRLSSDAARPGDFVVLSGTIGDHGVAVMSKRENLEFETQILSDSVALHGLVAAMVAAGGAGIRVMRDPTRGGLAATLNEFAHQSARRLCHRGGGDPGARRSRRRVRISRARSAQRRQRRQARRDRSRLMSSRATLAAMKAHPLGSRGRNHRPRGRRRQLLRRNAHCVRRRPHRRLAFGRTTAADLLSRDAHPARLPQLQFPRPAPARRAA